MDQKQATIPDQHGDKILISTILHIGAGKCGSSALQTTLSRYPVLDSSDGTKTHYLALRHDRPSFHGNKLSSYAATAPWGYISSVSANLLGELSESQIQGLSSELKLISGGKDRILLSNEGWINEHKKFEKSDLLINLGLSATVIVYVRAPVEWLNSAWWQWGAWSGVPLDKWLNANLENVRWHGLIAPWKSLRGVEKVIVRLLPSDIVTDFCNTIDVQPIPSKRSNSGLPGTILRLYQRHRALRKSPHDSASDFLFSKHFGHIASDPTPWVLGPYMIKRILKATRESNTELMGLLDDDSRTSMANDPRWWDSEAFSDKKKSPPVLENLPSPGLEKVAVAALSSIRELDDENRNLKKRLHELSEKLKQIQAGQDPQTNPEVQ